MGQMGLVDIMSFLLAAKSKLDWVLENVPMRSIILIVSLLTIAVSKQLVPKVRPLVSRLFVSYSFPDLYSIHVVQKNCDCA